jgi:hypothetical protein
VIYRYAHALLTRIPMLAELIERETAEAIDLTNGVTVEIMAASFRSVRGHTLIAALCDEIAFWRSDDSANPDVEIIAALRPAIATIPSAMLLCASSPYAPSHRQARHHRRRSHPPHARRTCRGPRRFRGRDEHPRHHLGPRDRGCAC